MGDVVQLPVTDRRNRSARLTAMSAAEIDEIVVAHDQAVAEGAIDEVEFELGWWRVYDALA